ncbi:MAG: Stp1/IreP family PP2C-type Ser/Thr phosphatase [Candidatus Limivivens sp.]|nr:Stp1/IreP family PP2C-type Ser/Thr phosphatase [Candidatus Limivivens sp.]
MNAYCLTDVGRRRSSNQDYVYISEKPIGNLPNLFVVADGMGGHNAGDLASRYAVETLIKAIKKEKKERNPIQIIGKGIEKANEEVLKKAGTDPGLTGMGTTMVAATVSEGCLYVANVGDSRLYLIRDQIRQVTRDHSLVEEMVRMGELTEEEARNHPDKNIITRAIGVHKKVRVDFFDEDLQGEDTILMCSDGLSNMVTDQDMKEIVRDCRNLQEAARKLIETANENGGRDNIAVVLVKPMTGEVKRC